MRSLETKILKSLAMGNKSADDLYKILQPERQQDMWVAISTLQKEGKIKAYFQQIGPSADFFASLDPNLCLCYKINIPISV